MTAPTAAQRDVNPEWDVLYWLVAVEAAMHVHRRVYPGDRHWRRWIRAQALDDQWFDRLVRQAGAILDGRASRFIDPDDRP